MSFWQYNNWKSESDLYNMIKDFLKSSWRHTLFVLFRIKAILTIHTAYLVPVYMGKWGESSLNIPFYLLFCWYFSFLAQFFIFLIVMLYGYPFIENSFILRHPESFRSYETMYEKNKYRINKVHGGELLWKEMCLMTFGQRRTRSTWTVCLKIWLSIQFVFMRLWKTLIRLCTCADLFKSFLKANF